MSEKVTDRHLCRKAILYVRQSTAQQLVHNEESRRLQYAMGDRLRGLGWRHVDVIDEDLGRSASGVVERAGFQRLVAEVSLGEVGVVGARELSRFARNSRDWQKLLEVCRYVDTLLVDQDTVYDARLSNDRLLLGLKGSLNEYELELLRLRAHEARREKASRGEFLAKIAVGYRKREDGTLEKTPDLRVQHVLLVAFAKSIELGSALQCVYWLRENEVQVPTNRNHRGEVIWKPPSYGWLHQVLTNPIYAGAYVYGRTRTQAVFVDGEPHQKVARRPREEWPVLLRQHHEAYIEWEQFERIQQMLTRNSQRRRPAVPGAAKKGAALLAGLLRCRRCGAKLMVNYSGTDGSVHRYACTRNNANSGGARCINFSGLDVDERVSRAVLDVVQPAAVEASLRAAAEVARADDDALATLRLELRAAQYAAERAFRQFDAVDPENRLVADELESRWNETLQRVRELEARVHAHEADTTSTHEIPSAEIFAELAANLACVWDHPATDVRLRKRIVRTLIEEIIVDVAEAPPEILLVVHWKGGVHTELQVRRLRRGHNRTQTSADVVEAVRALALVCRDEQIAGCLNRAALLTAKGSQWTRALVASLRSGNRIERYSPERQEREGWLTLEHAADLVGLASMTVKRAIGRGVLAAKQPLPGGPWLIRRDEIVAKAHDGVLKKGRPRRDKAAVPTSRQLSLIIPRT